MSVRTTCLVGVDGSGPSRAAVRWACIAADALDWRLVFAHFLPASATLAEERAASDFLVETAANHPDARLVIERGDVVEGLAGLASSGDVIAVGTHKTGFVRGRALGSLGIRLAARSPRSIAVIPDGQFASRRDVVLGVGPTVATDHALLAAGAAATALHQDLMLLHVSVPGREDDAERAHERLADASAAAIAHYPDLVVRSRVVNRASSDGLLDASRSASLLVLDSNRSTSATIGPVTHDVLMNLGSPVLLSRVDSSRAEDPVAPLPPKRDRENVVSAGA